MTLIDIKCTPHHILLPRTSSVCDAHNWRKQNTAPSRIRYPRGKRVGLGMRCPRSTSATVTFVADVVSQEDGIRQR